MAFADQAGAVSAGTELGASRWILDSWGLQRAEDDFSSGRPWEVGGLIVERSTFAALRSAAAVTGDTHFLVVGLPISPALEHPAAARIRDLALSSGGAYLGSFRVGVSSTAESIEVASMRAHAAYVAGKELLVSGEVGGALDAFSDALGYALQAEDAGAEGAIRNWLGMVFAADGDREGAARLHLEALEILRDVGDQPGEAAASHNLGRISFQLLRTEEGTKHFERAIAIYRALGDSANEAETCGEFEWCRAHAQAAT
jgi:tetratricopeptide (TPR) repeat protein